MTTRTPAYAKQTSEAKHTAQCTKVGVGQGANVMSLQRTAGNQAVLRNETSRTPRTNLRISQPGDAHEQEANRVANAVMRMGSDASLLSIAQGVQNEVQREEADKQTEESWIHVYGGTEKNDSNDFVVAGISRKIGDKTDSRVEIVKPNAKYTPPKGWDLDCFVLRDGTVTKFPGKLAALGLQMKLDTVEAKSKFPQYVGDAGRLFQQNAKPQPSAKGSVLQRHSDGARAVKDESTINTGHLILGNGYPLNSTTRAFFEPRFGVDLSGIRVHTNSIADDSAKSVNAVAFTIGRDIVFADNQFRPETSDGKMLLAHELTHVIQQGECAQHEYAPSTAMIGTPNNAGIISRKKPWENETISENQESQEVVMGPPDHCLLGTNLRSLTPEEKERETQQGLATSTEEVVSGVTIGSVWESTDPNKFQQTLNLDVGVTKQLEEYLRVILPEAVKIKFDKGLILEREASRNKLKNIVEESKKATGNRKHELENQAKLLKQNIFRIDAQQTTFNLVKDWMKSRIARANAEKKSYEDSGRDWWTEGLVVEPSEEIAVESAKQLCNVISFFNYGRETGNISKDKSFPQYFLEAISKGHIGLVRQKTTKNGERKGIEGASLGSGSGELVAQWNLHAIRGNKPISEEDWKAFDYSGVNIAISYQRTGQDPVPNHFLIIVRANGVWRNMDHTSTSPERRGGKTDPKKVYQLYFDEESLRKARRLLERHGLLNEPVLERPTGQELI